MSADPIKPEGFVGHVCPRRFCCKHIRMRSSSSGATPARHEASVNEGVDESSPRQGV